MGEGGCLFDEIQNLVEPTERRYMGEQHRGERQHTEVLAGLRTRQESVVKQYRLDRSEAG